MTLKIPNNPISNGTHDLPACNAVRPLKDSYTNLVRRESIAAQTDRSTRNRPTCSREIINWCSTAIFVRFFICHFVCLFYVNFYLLQ